MSLLKGQIAIITGAGTGIGRSAALKFAAAGATVVLSGRRQAPLDEVAAEIQSDGGTSVVMTVDLESGDSAAKLGRDVLAQFGKVDVLVNNAGHSTKVRTVQHVSPAEWESVFKVNVEGVYRLTQSVVGAMVEAGGGTVITVSSMAALQPGLLGGVPYSAAKAASFAMMRGLNAELRNQGIRACTVFPAEVDTPILDNRPLPPDADARATMMMPEDIADAIFLCAAMPSRTIVEQVVLLPTIARDVSADVQSARDKVTVD